MHIERWKIIAVALVLLTGILGAIPNLLPRDVVEAAPSWLPAKQINLGLDLQGGSHLLLEVGVGEVLDERLDSFETDVRLALRTERYGFRGMDVADQTLSFSLTDPATRGAIETLLDDLNPLMVASTFGGTPSREFDIAETAQGFAITLSEQGRRQRIDSAVTQSLEVIRRRIDEVGTREPTIQRQGEDRVLVQVPGLEDPEEVKRLLGKTARLTFHMVDMGASVQEALAGRIPADALLFPSVDDAGPSHYVVKKKVEVSGEDLEDAQPSFQDNQPVVSFRFNTTGARKFGNITQDHTGELFAIVLDDEVISAPRIREPILGGSGIISGSFTVDSASELAVLLRAGALPAPLSVVEERSVGPDLGADSVRAGAIASILALSLVAIFMVAYYGVFGIMADIALISNLILIMAALSTLGATLTLPGIAGLVLTVGMAVDSNVLIFERIHEEIKTGKTPIAAIDTGFSQALRTVVDANLTTLIAAVVLFSFGTGPIKGFAVTLSIGIVTTLFTTLVMTRMMIWLWYRQFRPKLIPL